MIENLISGEKINVIVDEQIVFSELEWMGGVFMLASGYLGRRAGI